MGDQSGSTLAEEIDTAVQQFMDTIGQYQVAPIMQEGRIIEQISAELKRLYRIAFAADDITSRWIELGGPTATPSRNLCTAVKKWKEAKRE